MTVFQHNPRFTPPQATAAAVSCLDSTRYTLDLLEGLRKIADGQGLGTLAHMLELAQCEARIVIREQTDPGNQAQQTRLPG